VISQLFGPTWRRPVVATLVILAAVVAMQVSHVVHRERILPEAAVAQAAKGPVNIEVRTGFAPEAFNVKYLQRFANAVSIDGHTALLFGVRPDGLRAIAALPWIDSIKLMGVDQ
jgi:hypothetical protein